jgi:hypothetical protein
VFEDLIKKIDLDVLFDRIYLQNQKTTADESVVICKSFYFIAILTIERWNLNLFVF